MLNRTVVLLSVLGCLASADWRWLNPLPTGNTFNAVHFLDNRNGLAAGDQGAVARTTDGGATWDNVDYTGPWAYAVEWVDACLCPGTRTAYAITASGWSKTTDGGASWADWQQFLSFKRPRAIAFPEDDRTGYVVGDSTRVDPQTLVLKTTDGGASWHNVCHGFLYPALDVEFPNDAQTGYVVGGWDSPWVGFIRKTSDGGETWTEQRQHARPVRSISFPDDELTGYALADRDVVFKTTDGGATWDSISIVEPDPTSAGLCIEFVSPDTGFALSGIVWHSAERLHRTTDGGATWETDTVFGMGMKRLAFPAGPDTGFAAGIAGVLYQTNDRGDNWELQTRAATWQTLYSACFPVNADSGFVAGSRTLLETTDGGESWEPVGDFDSTHVFNSVAFPAGADTGFVAGYNAGGGFICRTTDRGVSWDTVLCPAVGGIVGLDFPRGLDVGYALTSQFVYRATDRGRTWELLVPPSTRILRGFHFASADTGFLVGDGGQIVRTTNGGDSWQVLPNSITDDLYAVQLMPGGQAGFVGGDLAYFARTTDGGLTWSGDRLPSYFPSPFYDILFPTDSDTGYMVGERVLLRTTNLGDSWTRQGHNIGTSLLSLCFPNDNATGYAVGFGGSILTTRDAGGGIAGPPLVRGRPDCPKPATTVARNVLIVFGATQAELFDIGGRKVGKLQPGPNDVSGLAPGVYFIGPADGTPTGRARKVVVTD